MTASSMLSYIEALVKKIFFNFMLSFCSASFETSKSKFLAHLDEPLKNYPYFTDELFKNYVENMMKIHVFKVWSLL